MKISYNWLKQYVQTDLSPEEMGKILTDTGLEVEGIEKIETVKGGLEGVLIGEVLTCEKHPDADKLKVTTVSLGSGEPVQIEFNTDNAAFEDSFLMEVTRTLQQCKSALLDSERGTITIRHILKDSNGNRIGVINIGNN